MAKDKDKTNVMRILDSKKIAYNVHTYDADPTLTGEQIAGILGEDKEKVFKTLVTVAKSGEHYVFVVPVAKELNLKKAAKAASEKSIDMIKQKELLPLTGYVHGGCSPIGMKKQFKTFIHETAKDFDRIYISAGRVGAQIDIDLCDLDKLVRLDYVDIIVDN
ncbi:MAG: Cys-tRNA(Pro) deacylase [Lachnospiraceae bacterium]|nr:Cys-tRNA(Pro) deacylase [Lachnospiraceae bacterium]